jgi:polyhydroxybutyrate depolymerase
MSRNVILKNRFSALVLVIGIFLSSIATHAQARIIGHAAGLIPTFGSTSFYQAFTNTANSDTRSVLFITPAFQPAGRNAPVIVMLHYDTGTPELQANLSNAGMLAAKMGYWVILPPAIDGHWSDDPAASTTDDVGFLSTLITQAISQFPIDSTRIAMVGFSNGGFMTQRMACERPDLIASGVSVAASMRTSLADQCAPSRPIPMIYVLGTADPVVPYTGAQSKSSAGSFLSAADSLAKWSSFNHCGATGGTTTQLPVVVSDGTSVTLQHNANCASGGEVDLYTVNNGGHSWPGPRYLSYPGLGTISRNLQATSVVGNFAKLWTDTSTH